MRLIHVATVFAFAAVAGCDAASNLSSPSGGRPSLDVGGGNSSAAHACYHHGWDTLQTSDGTKFTNDGDCVSYAAGGGTLAPQLSAPVIQSFVVTSDNQLLAVFTSAVTGVVRDVGGDTQTITSGVAAPITSLCGGPLVLTVTNSLGQAQAVTIFNSSSACA